MLNIVTIKFMAPASDETPAMCKLKIDSSTELVACAKALLSGGYKVHPVPDPPSVILETTVNTKAGTINHKLMLFNLGKAISGAPTSKGTNQFPNSPSSIGITVKKIIINA
jgi:hypothetical protein